MLSQIIPKLKHLLMQALSCEHLARTQLEIVDIVDACVACLVFDSFLYWLLCDTPVSQDLLIDTISDFLAGGLSRIFTPK